MSNVEFEGDYKPVQRPGPQGIPNFQNQFSNTPHGMAGWLMRKGIIKEESQAKGILLLVVLVNFVLMGIVFYVFVL